ncbi:MAG: DNA translocase FtsK 4TM domain-containing protein [Candidatus Nitrotoga sp.]|nr:DNA translocase FtsK 4TM domain-containing protein [Candidatus Nitrotoga sp.]MBP0117092.1 DNA translocase FtsK 4TM domain-containing protein [Candidatus Nitrotoga sp.]MBP0122748.1 DNA translocase FtsK 4TM domain-containing protein [Candidatus Nitrotoga sp.]MBP0125435.1 DNA translocase FtsK 4TM domain-containing protein [Candidatus Nitrotoga sp.]
MEYERTMASLKNKPKETSLLAVRLAVLLRESRLILLGAAAFYLILVLYGYDRNDPAWSHSASNVVPHNAGGIVGAWSADILLYVFGFSAWWWAVLLSQKVWIGYRGIAQNSLFDRRALWIALLGFALLLVASSSLEALRLHTLRATLPYIPGGMLGTVLGDGLAHLLGFTGATMLLLVLMAIGFSLFSGLSWLRFIDRLGVTLETFCRWTKNVWLTWQDRRIGAQALNERQVVVEEEKRRVESHMPIYIEQSPIEVKQSARVLEEKQVPLFSDMPDSLLPQLHLLDQPTYEVEVLSADTLEFTSRLIERKLQDFGVDVKVVAAYPGPVVTRYEIDPAVGVKGSQITSLVRDLARALSVVSLRVVETIPGKSYMALELPNPNRQMVRLSEILSSQDYADMHSSLTMAMGKDISGKPVVADLGKMPHVLVAGTTGSGKSVAINAMILSLLYKATPQQVRLLLVDPKMLELSVYEGIPHLLAPVVTDMSQAASVLNWCVKEMDKRYRLMSSMGVRNIAGYNQKVRDAIKAGSPLTNPFTLTPDHPEAADELPFIVVFIDELADLMMVVGRKVEVLIARLAQKARASGIHLVLATQRPSVDVITGLIKANVPTRVAFQVSSKIDSRTILDQMGAEALLGQGDMLYLPPGAGYPQRVHGAFVSDQEVHRVVEYLKMQGAPQYIEGVLTSADELATDGDSESGASAEADALYDQAVEIVVKSRRASISLVQRHLRIGYNRAARLVEQMERAGVVTPMQGNGNREVIAPARPE